MFLLYYRSKRQQNLRWHSHKWLSSHSWKLIRIISYWGGRISFHSPIKLSFIHYYFLRFCLPTTFDFWIRNEVWWMKASALVERGYSTLGRSDDAFATVRPSVPSADRSKSWKKTSVHDLLQNENKKYVLIITVVQSVTKQCDAHNI